MRSATAAIRPARGGLSDVSAASARVTPMPLKIGMVLQAPFPPDVRVMKEARTLIEAGPLVSTLCAPDPGKPPRDQWESVRIVRAAVPARESIRLKADY